LQLQDVVNEGRCACRIYLEEGLLVESHGMMFYQRSLKNLLIELQGSVMLCSMASDHVRFRQGRGMISNIGRD
jgi:hypothetical protein